MAFKHKRPVFRVYASNIHSSLPYLLDIELSCILSGTLCKHITWLLRFLLPMYEVVKRVHAKYTLNKGSFLWVLLGFDARFSVIGRRLRFSVIGPRRSSLVVSSSVIGRDLRSSVIGPGLSSFVVRCSVIGLCLCFRSSSLFFCYRFSSSFFSVHLSSVPRLYFTVISPGLRFLFVNSTVIDSRLWNLSSSMLFCY
jgi:hypothetical protein